MSSLEDLLLSFLESLVFYRENDMISSVLYVFLCYITCIAHTFDIDGIKKKNHGSCSLDLYLKFPYSAPNSFTALKIL